MYAIRSYYVNRLSNLWVHESPHQIFLLGYNNKKRVAGQTNKAESIMILPCLLDCVQCSAGGGGAITGCHRFFVLVSYMFLSALLIKSSELSPSFDMVIPALIVTLTSPRNNFV